MLMRIPIFVSTLLLVCLGKICTQPQRGGVMSFSALSSRDHITKVFYEVDAKMSLYNATATNNSVQYNITNLKPQFYYVDNTQLNEFVDSLTANVTSGKLYLAAAFNYSYKGDSLVKGFAITKVLLDTFSFTKRIITDKGYIEWDPVEVGNITMHSLFAIESSTPPLTHSTLRFFETILNDQLQIQNGMKDKILAEVNTRFQAELKTQLNSENIINTGNLTYSYKGANLTYTNEIYYLSLSNNDDFIKGLKYSYLFELEGYTKNCNILPMFPDKAQGGVQEIISMQTFRATFNYGLEKGLFDAQLDSKWQSSIFQFYAGDVSNFIDQLSKANPTTPITGDCKYDSTLPGANLVYQSSNAVVVTIPYRCSLKTNTSTIQTMTFSATFEVDFYARNNSLRAVIGGAYLSGVKFIDEGAYKVTDNALGAYYILNILRTLEGRETFGTGFPTQLRKFPLLKVTQNYTVIYDPSQL